MTDPREAHFEPLDFRKRVLVPFNPNQYRVVSFSGEIKEVQANTAYEAFRQSGLSEAIKIERIFIFNRNVIPEDDFSDREPFKPADAFDDIFGDSHGEGSDPLAHFRRRKNPIISAIELDALMRALQAMEAEGAHGRSGTIEADTVSISAALPVTATQAEHGEDHNERISVPPPSPMEPVPESIAGAGPVGLDVHGDGFDEIIPVATASKPAASPRIAETKEAAQPGAQPPDNTAPAAEPEPERELSGDEIEALLNGK